MRLFPFIDRSFRSGSLPLLPPVFALSFWAPTIVAATLVGGPMSGLTTAERASIWLMTDHPARVEIEYWPAGEPQSLVRSTSVRTHAADGHTAQLELKALTPDTRYRYRVVIDGRPLASEPALAFATQPVHGSPPRDVLIATGSCSSIPDSPRGQDAKSTDTDYGIFDTIARLKPNLMLWLGDYIYYRDSDVSDDSGTLMNARWAATRKFAPLQRLLHTGGHLAIWDDHDFGPNNSDRTFALKGVSLELFKRYWINGAFGLPGVPGIFSKASLSDMDFFLLDDRYYRDADASLPSPDMTMLGARQLEWLKEELLASTANFKLIVNGSRMLSEKPSPTERGGEGWHNFPEERAGFLNWLRSQRIDGVFFLSGDIHYTHLTQRERTGTYSLTELTCSPLTSRVHPEPFPVNETPGTLVTQRNFCTLEVTGPSGNRVLTISSRGAAGNLFWREEFSASSLRF